MYGKIFEQIYDGTLTEHWEALVTFQQMIILCDADGVCDVTLQALHRRTGIPVDILERGIAFLEAPDTESRSPESEGRRIVRIDEHRSWGWRLTNHAKYRDLKSSDRVREQNRERVRRHRERKKRNECNACNVTGNDVTLLSRHTDTDTDTDQEIYIKQVFEHWKKTFDHPDARLDDTRRQIILARRTDGYEATHLTKAIDGCRKTPWNMGENSRCTVMDDLTLILESAKNVDRFMAHDDNPPMPAPKREGKPPGAVFIIDGEKIVLPRNDGSHDREYAALQRKFEIDLRGLSRADAEKKMRRKLGELAGATA